MADHCVVCDTRRPAGGTKVVVLNGGALWLEFCASCGDTVVCADDTGKEWTPNQLFDSCKQRRESQS